MKVLVALRATGALKAASTSCTMLVLVSQQDREMESQTETPRMMAEDHT